MNKLKRSAIALAISAPAAIYVASAGFLLSISGRHDVRFPALSTEATAEWAALPMRAYREHKEWAETRKGIDAKMSWARLGGALFALVPPVLVLMRRKEEAGIYGDARWPTLSELRDAGLLAKSGFVLGRIGKRTMRLAGELGALILAPPGSGKGAGVLEPNLLMCGKEMSVIVNDIKGDLFKKCAGWMRHAFGHRVFVLSLLDLLSHKWNVWGYVPPYEVDPAGCFDAIQNIANQQFPHVEGGANGGFWQDNARLYHLSLALYQFETPGSLRTMGEILRQGMAQDADGFAAHWKSVIEAREATLNPLSQRLKQMLYELITLPSQTIGGIRAHWSSALELWQNPIIDAATSPGKCGDIGDFDLRLMRQKLMAVFIKIPPKSIARLRPLLNLFWEQALGLQCDDLPEDYPRKLKYHLGLLMDEGPACGYLRSLATYAGFLRQFWVRLMFVGQDEAQIESIYGPKVAQVLMSMLAVRIHFPPQHMSQAEALSRELGTYTAMLETRSSGNGRTTINRTPKERRLLNGEEVMRLGGSKQLVFYKEPGSPGADDRESVRPALVNRIYSFASELKRRMFYPPPRVPKLQIVMNRPPIVTPELPGRLPTVEDAKTLDKMPAKRFVADPQQRELPFTAPKTQTEANALVALFNSATAALMGSPQGVAHAV